MVLLAEVVSRRPRESDGLSSTQACLRAGCSLRRQKASDPTPCQSFSSSVRPPLITPDSFNEGTFHTDFWNAGQGITRSLRRITAAFPHNGRDVRRIDSSSMRLPSPAPFPSLQGTGVLTGRQPCDLPSASGAQDLLISLYIYEH